MPLVGMKNMQNEILNPILRANELKKHLYETAIVLGTLEERRIPKNSIEETEQCAECGSDIPRGAERCVCGAVI